MFQKCCVQSYTSALLLTSDIDVKGVTVQYQNYIQEKRKALVVCIHIVL